MYKRLLYSTDANSGTVCCPLIKLNYKHFNTSSVRTLLVSACSSVSIFVVRPSAPSPPHVHDFVHLFCKKWLHGFYIIYCTSEDLLLEFLYWLDNFSSFIAFFCFPLGRFFKTRNTGYCFKSYEEHKIHKEIKDYYIVCNNWIFLYCQQNQICLWKTNYS